MTLKSKGINPGAPNPRADEGQRYRAGKVRGNGSRRPPSPRLLLHDINFIYRLLSRRRGKEERKGEGFYLPRQAATCFRDGSQRGMLRSPSHPVLGASCGGPRLATEHRHANGQDAATIDFSSAHPPPPKTSPPLEGQTPAAPLCSSSSGGFRQELVHTKPGEVAWVRPLHAKALPEAALAAAFLHCLHPEGAASEGGELQLPGVVGQHVTHIKYGLREGKTAALG